MNKPHSSESKLKIKKTKQKKWLNSLKWEYAEPYLNTIFENGSRNREKLSITFAKFKELAEQGNTTLDMIELGYVKGLLNFMGIFLQGRISLSKEKFIEEYIKTGLSLSEISIKYNISRENMTQLRAMYEIRVTGPKYQQRKKQESKLTNRQKQIIIGSMLGDAGKFSPSVVRFKHGTSQKDYLMWKFNELKNISSENSLVYIPYITDTGTDAISYRFYTKANSDVEYIISKFYKSGKKIVPLDLLDDMGILGIAVWFMDDGKSDFKINSKYDVSPEVYICTDMFTWSDCESICKWFNNKYKLECNVSTSSKGHPRIKFPAKSSKVFLSLIYDYVIPSMKYKVSKKTSKYKKENSTINEKYKKICLESIYQISIGNEFKYLPLEQQDEDITNIVNNYHKVGYSILSKDTKDVIDDGKALAYYDSSILYKDDCISFSKIGHQFCNSHFPHFLRTCPKARSAPGILFENSRYLGEVVRNIIHKGKYPTPNLVLRELKTYRGNRGISSFMPAQAASIYNKYCKQDASVIDFCAGYGGRLMGAMVSNKVKYYCAIEPNHDTFCGLKKLNHSLNKLLYIKKEVEFINQTSILGMSNFKDKSFDFCFTSVPYFDTEEYSHDVTQSYVEYPVYSKWFNNFFIKSIEEALRISKTVAINVNNAGPYEIADNFRDWINDNNIELQEDRIQFPKFGGGNKYEPLFVLNQ